MIQEKIHKLIINGCQGDVLAYREVLKKSKTNIEDELDAKNQFSYIVEILIITIKSLMPSYEEVRTVIDYERLNKELKLWKDYRHGGNAPLMNFDNTDNINYWMKPDNSVYSRIFAIIITNKNFDFIKDEVIKNILYTTGNIKILLQSIVISKILFLLINNKTIKYEDLIKEVKEEVIKLSQKDIFERYDDNFKLKRNTYNGNYSLDFERNRINLINLFNGIDSIEYKLIEEILYIIKNDTRDFEDVKSNFLTYALVGLLNEDIKNTDIKDKDFLESLCLYLDKLRNGRISPETLIINNYDLADIFKFSKDDEFNHSLLNRCKIIKKYEDKRYIKSYVYTKSGIYRFIKIKHL